MSDVEIRIDPGDSIRARIHRPLGSGCECGWKPGVWNCTTYGNHIGRIVDDLMAAGENLRRLPRPAIDTTGFRSYPLRSLR